MKQYGPIENPYVTVAVAVYNEEACIKECIASLLKQDFKPLEILVVDDGSTDNSVKICESLNVKVLSGRHQGMGAARNAGARNAKGNIVVLLDADMTFAPEYVSRLVAPIIRGEEIATGHWNEMVSNWNNPWARCQTWFSGLPDGRRHRVAVAEKSRQYRAVRKDFFLDSGGFSEQDGYNADTSISFRTEVWSKTIPEASCYHRNVESLSEAFKEAAWHGRNLVSVSLKNRRLWRSIISTFIFRNPLGAFWHGLRLGVAKKEPRLLIYSVIYSVGLLFGVVAATCSGNYQK